VAPLKQWKIRHPQKPRLVFEGRWLALHDILAPELKPQRSQDILGYFQFVGHDKDDIARLGAGGFDDRGFLSVRKKFRDGGVDGSALAHLEPGEALCADRLRKLGEIIHFLARERAAALVENAFHRSTGRDVGADALKPSAAKRISEIDQLRGHPK